MVFDGKVWIFEKIEDYTIAIYEKGCSKLFSCEIIRLLSTYKRVFVGISLFVFFKHFWYVFKMWDRYIAERIGERVNPWPTSIFVENKGERKSFYEYMVDQLAW